ncbi:MAG: dephospho-CoA kinase [archaeon]
MILAVTGKIGSGKSTVARMFSGNIIDADRIGHEILAVVKDELVSAFGEAIVKNGKVDRKALAGIAFAGADGVKRLNEITHPHIIQEIKKRIMPGLNIIDAALYSELGIDKVADKVIVVRTDKLRIDPELAKRQIFQKEVKNPDYVVVNNDINEARKQVEDIKRFIKSSK